jgi:hypothetical protein
MSDYADLLALGVPADLCPLLQAGSLEQTCPACGATSVATWRCYRCFGPTGPADWSKPPVSERRLAALGQMRLSQAVRRSGLAKSPIPGDVA